MEQNRSGFFLNLSFLQVLEFVLFIDAMLTMAWGGFSTFPYRVSVLGQTGKQIYWWDVVKTALTSVNKETYS